jgi:Dolichyl-phosphate-mannose-protein mannosyltransferase
VIRKIGIWPSNASIFILGLILLTSSIVRIPLLQLTLNESFGFRQAQTAIAVREYMRHGFLQLSPLPIFGNPWQVPMEFPIFQIVAAVIGSITHLDAAVASRAASLVFFQIAAILIFLVARKAFDSVAALAAVALFEFSPYGMQWGSAALIESLAACLVLLSIYLLWRWGEERKTLFLQVAVAAAMAGFLVKSTTPIPWIPVFAAVLYASKNEASSVSKVKYWFSGMSPVWLGLLAGLIWTRFADVYKGQNPYSAELTSSALRDWYIIGQISPRFDIDNWNVIIEYMAFSRIWMFYFVAPIIALVLWKKVRVFTIALSAVYLIAVLIFFKLYFVHSYYHMAVFPATVLIWGAAIWGLSKKLPSHGWMRYFTVALAMVTLLSLSWMSKEGGRVRENQSGLLSLPSVVGQMRGITAKDDVTILIGCDWNPIYSYYADRRVIMVTSKFEGIPMTDSLISSEVRYVGFCQDLDLNGLNKLLPGRMFKPVAPNLVEMLPN